MFWLGWLIMSVAASDFSLLSDRALHDNPLVAGKLVLVRLGEVEARTRLTRHTEPHMRPLEHRELYNFQRNSHILASSERNISLFICHGIIPDICFTIYFTSKKCQRKCNYHYSLFEGLSHTYTQSLFYRLYFKVVHCNLLLLSCQPVCQLRLLQVGRSTARWLAHAQFSQYSKSDLKVYQIRSYCRVTRVLSFMDNHWYLQMSIQIFFVVC